MKTEFELIRATSGAWTVRHTKHGVLLHSAVDPIKEAGAIANKLCQSASARIVVIGGGLGYLREELLSRGKQVSVIEPFLEVDDLDVKCGANINASALISQSSVKNLGRELSLALSDTNADVYVAPYVRAMLDELSTEDASLISEFLVLENSREEYAPLIEQNMRENSSVFSKLPAITSDVLSSCSIAVACGAGPSLRDVIETLKACRSRIQLVACSSAVPTLKEEDLQPDWTIALEAHNGVARDLEFLDKKSRVVVFPWTEPEALRLTKLRRYAANRDENMLATHGGTTLLTAADLAEKMADDAVCLVGSDLSWSPGIYARVPMNMTALESGLRSLKFEFMRKRIETWIETLPATFVHHVISDSELTLKGAMHLLPSELRGFINRKFVIERKHTHR